MIGRDRFGEFLRDYELYLDGKLSYDDLRPHLPRVAAVIAVAEQPVNAAMDLAESGKSIRSAVASAKAAQYRLDLLSMFLLGAAIGLVTALAAGALKAFA